MDKLLLFVFFTLICTASTIFLGDEGSLIKAATLIKSLNPALPISRLPPTEPFPGSILGPIVKGGCPLCDQSVYSYCSYKVIHDACCCNAGNFEMYHSIVHHPIVPI
ncbi:uncharacterized protein LOC116347054 isoform X2 [Contarinia nasturtii]|uniref:uncharacterized protein LOC116347054 isoform X2 n=1 Tax=Contarinia nasturtii TaxID=265458 RepID=UPI0012D4B743|nr:uncharacterized protein LOC116347054 isoform X2 [Contarinia nasturtii]